MLPSNPTGTLLLLLLYTMVSGSSAWSFVADVLADKTSPVGTSTVLLTASDVTLQLDISSTAPQVVQVLFWIGDSNAAQPQAPGLYGKTDGISITSLPAPTVIPNAVRYQLGPYPLSQFKQFTSFTCPQPKSVQYAIRLTFQGDIAGTACKPSDGPKTKGNWFCTVSETCACPFVSIEALANGVKEALVQVDQTVTFQYKVTNVGSVPLTSVVMVDDVLGILSLPSSTILGPSESWLYEAQTVALAGKHVHTGTVTATHSGLPVVSASDNSSYFGYTCDFDWQSGVFGSLSYYGGQLHWILYFTPRCNIVLEAVKVTLWYDGSLDPITGTKSFLMRLVEGDVNGNLMLDSAETWTMEAYTPNLGSDENGMFWFEYRIDFDNTRDRAASTGSPAGGSFGGPAASMVLNDRPPAASSTVPAWAWGIVGLAGFLTLALGLALYMSWHLWSKYGARNSDLFDAPQPIQASVFGSPQCNSMYHQPSPSYQEMMTSGHIHSSEDGNP